MGEVKENREDETSNDSRGGSAIGGANIENSHMSVQSIFLLLDTVHAWKVTIDGMNRNKVLCMCICVYFFIVCFFVLTSTYSTCAKRPGCF